MSMLKTNMTNYGGRKVVDYFMRGLTIGATSLAIIPLALIIGYVLIRGGSALNVAFFTETYTPPVAAGLDIDALAGGDLGLGSAGDPNAAVDPNATVDPFAGIGIGVADPNATVDPNATADPFAGIDLGSAVGGESGTEAGAGSEAAVSEVGAAGGVLHGIVGTLLVTLVALLMALPIGLLAGVFLSEYGESRVANFVRFCSDVLSGAPSIVIGVVGYVLLVQQTRTYSGIAGAVALTFLMVPTITRATEEILKLVPNSVREAALAMGAPNWYSTFTVVVPTALSGIVTGTLLAFARGAGETAPLLLTALNNNNLSANLFAPIATLPVLTYTYYNEPFPAVNQLAWGTAFVLMVTVLLVNILVRLATANRLKGR